MLAIKGIVIGGDFNTNHDHEMFAAEKTLDSLIGAAIAPFAAHNSPRHSWLSGRDL